MILALLAAAHWMLWTPETVQVGVAMGPKDDPRLIMLVPREGCGAGVRVYWGQYRDVEAAADLMENSKVCTTVEKRAADESVRRANMAKFAAEHPWVIRISAVSVLGKNGSEMKFKDATYGSFRTQAECAAALDKQSKGSGVIANVPIPFGKMICMIPGIVAQ